MWFVLLGIPVGWLARKWFVETKPTTIVGGDDLYDLGYQDCANGVQVGDLSLRVPAYQNGYNACMADKQRKLGLR